MYLVYMCFFCGMRNINCNRGALSGFSANTDFAAKAGYPFLDAAQSERTWLKLVLAAQALTNITACE